MRTRGAGGGTTVALRGAVHANDIDLMELDPLIGLELDGRWIVLEALARGGMGTVYRGVHMELGREAAIKVLSPTYARSEEAVLRFLREARTTARIDHPNIVPTVDLGRLDSGAPYLVMELLEGEDLADLIAREAPLSMHRVVELLSPVGRALDAVHGAGLLHRDVKPANVFLARRPGGTVSPVLIDFGLATLREETEDDRRLTRDGIVVGTPHYVSPEAAEGDPIDERADVYSLALVAFELLTGVLPIDGAEAGALLVQKVRKPAPTMSERTGTSYPPALEQLIARALSRTPAKRPASAGAFIEALQAIADEGCAVPRITERPEPTRSEEEIVARHSSEVSRPKSKLPVWLGWGALLASVVAFVAWAPWTGDGIVARPLAPAQELDSLPPAPVAEAAAVPTPVASPRPEALPSLLGPEARASSAPAPRVIASVDRRVMAERARAAPPAVQLDERDPERAPALVREANAALLSGRFPRARDLFREATELDDTHAPAWRGLGLTNERMGMAPEAAGAYRRYLALETHAPDSDRVRERLARLTE